MNRSISNALYLKVELGELGAFWCTLRLLTLCFITVFVAARARAESHRVSSAALKAQSCDAGELLISQERDVLGSAGFTRGQALNYVRRLLRIGFCRAVWVK